MSTFLIKAKNKFQFRNTLQDFPAIIHVYHYLQWHRIGCQVQIYLLRQLWQRVKIQVTGRLIWQNQNQQWIYQRSSCLIRIGILLKDPRNGHPMKIEPLKPGIKVKVRWGRKLRNMCTRQTQTRLDCSDKPSRFSLCWESQKFWITRICLNKVIHILWFIILFCILSEA